MDNLFLVDFREAKITNENKTVLEKVNFQVGIGELVYLTGRTGTGKTSFLKALYSELPVIEGRAIVNDFDLRTIKRKEIPDLRRSIGMVFQSFQLFQEWTAARNLSFVLQVTGWKDTKEMSQRIIEVLKSVGMEDKAKSKVHQLSGGEQQRLAIARALLNKPKLFIADEPTGNLDTESSDHIFHLLHDISKNTGTTLIIATHDRRIIDKFPARIFECADQRLTEI